MTLNGDLYENILDHSWFNSLSKEKNFHLGRNDEDFSDPSSISSKEGSPSKKANASAKCRNKFKTKIDHKP